MPNCPVDQTSLTIPADAIELSEDELEEVNGAWFGGWGGWGSCWGSCWGGWWGGWGSCWGGWWW